MELVTVVREALATEGFSITGIQKIETDIVLKRVIMISAPERSDHVIHDAFVADRKLHDHFQKLDQSWSGRHTVPSWTIAITTDNTFTEKPVVIKFFCPKRADSAHTTIKGALSEFLKKDSQ